MAQKLDVVHKLKELSFYVSKSMTLKSTVNKIIILIWCAIFVVSILLILRYSVKIPFNSTGNVRLAGITTVIDPDEDIPTIRIKSTPVIGVWNVPTNRSNLSFFINSNKSSIIFDDGDRTAGNVKNSTVNYVGLDEDLIDTQQDPLNKKYSSNCVNGAKDSTETLGFSLKMQRELRHPAEDLINWRPLAKSLHDSPEKMETPVCNFPKSDDYTEKFILRSPNSGILTDDENRKQPFHTRDFSDERNFSRQPSKTYYLTPNRRQPYDYFEGETFDLALDPADVPENFESDEIWRPTPLKSLDRRVKSLRDFTTKTAFPSPLSPRYTDDDQISTNTESPSSDIRRNATSNSDFSYAPPSKFASKLDEGPLKSLTLTLPELTLNFHEPDHRSRGATCGCPDDEWSNPWMYSSDSLESNYKTLQTVNEVENQDSYLKADIEPTPPEELSYVEEMDVPRNLAMAPDFGTNFKGVVPPSLDKTDFFNFEQPWKEGLQFDDSRIKSLPVKVGEHMYAEFSNSPAKKLPQNSGSEYFRNSNEEKAIIHDTSYYSAASSFEHTFDYFHDEDEYLMPLETLDDVSTTESTNLFDTYIEADIVPKEPDIVETTSANDLENSAETQHEYEMNPILISQKHTPENLDVTFSPAPKTTGEVEVSDDILRKIPRNNRRFDESKSKLSNEKTSEYFKQDFDPDSFRRSTNAAEMSGHCISSGKGMPPHLSLVSMAPEFADQDVIESIYDKNSYSGIFSSEPSYMLLNLEKDLDLKTGQVTSSNTHAFLTAVTQPLSLEVPNTFESSIAETGKHEKSRKISRGTHDLHLAVESKQETADSEDSDSTQNTNRNSKTDHATLNLSRSAPQFSASVTDGLIASQNKSTSLDVTLNPLDVKTYLPENVRSLLGGINLKNVNMSEIFRNARKRLSASNLRWGKLDDFKPREFGAFLEEDAVPKCELTSAAQVTGNEALQENAEEKLNTTLSEKSRCRHTISLKAKTDSSNNQPVLNYAVSISSEEIPSINANISYVNSMVPQKTSASSKIMPSEPVATNNVLESATGEKTPTYYQNLPYSPRSIQNTPYAPIIVHNMPFFPRNVQNMPFTPINSHQTAQTLEESHIIDNAPSSSPVKIIGASGTDAFTSGFAPINVQNLPYSTAIAQGVSQRKFYDIDLQSKTSHPEKVNLVRNPSEVRKNLTTGVEKTTCEKQCKIQGIASLPMPSDERKGEEFSTIGESGAFIQSLPFSASVTQKTSGNSAPMDAGHFVQSVPTSPALTQEQKFSRQPSTKSAQSTASVDDDVCQTMADKESNAEVPIDIIATDLGVDHFKSMAENVFSALHEGIKVVGSTRYRPATLQEKNESQQSVHLQPEIETFPVVANLGGDLEGDPQKITKSQVLLLENQNPTGTQTQPMIQFLYQVFNVGTCNNQ